MTDKPNVIFGKLFVEGANYDNLTSLDALSEFAHSAYQVIGDTPWTLATDKDLEKTTRDLRAGFMGTVLITSACLAEDGDITGIANKKPIKIDGIRLDLTMTLLPTGVSEIPLNAAVVIGNGARRFEIRAYDLREECFGTISCDALKQYLKSSQLKGGGTGETRVKATGISRRSSAQVRKK